MAQIVILKRAHFFSIDNDLIDVHAKTIGAIGVAIYAVLARFANRQTGECWPAIGRIARTLDLARSTVKVYLHKLKDAGIIDIIEREDEAGDPTSNLYTLLDPSPTAVDKRLTARSAPAAPTPEGGRPSADLPPVAYRPTGRPSADPEPSSSPEQEKENQPDDAHANGTPKMPVRNPCMHPVEHLSHFGDVTLCQHCWSMLELPTCSGAMGEPGVHREDTAVASAA
jgi:hypothetical protein